MKKKGFSVFELLAVIAIIGILTVIAIPTYNQQKQRMSFNFSSFGKKHEIRYKLIMQIGFNGEGIRKKLDASIKEKLNLLNKETEQKVRQIIEDSKK